MEGLFPHLDPCRVLYLPSTDSTNEECKRQAAQGAESGLVVIAGEQTGGKGRRGRSFQSLAGKGLYLSILWRPKAASEQLFQLTAQAAVAVCQTVESLTALSPAIKWPNDVLLEGKKLCGILTELEWNASGAPDCIVLGIGINVRQTPEDFGPDLSPIATSLAQHLPQPPRREEVAEVLVARLDRLWASFPQAREEYLAQYRRRCATIGQPVRLLRPGGSQEALALDVNRDFSLQVRLPDGREEAISSGEVSVRGLLGYT